MDNQKLKVLMFGWELPPHNTGGLGVACYGLAKGITSQGVNISFGLPRPLPDNIPFLDMLPNEINGFSVTALNSYLNPYQTNRQYLQKRQNSNKKYQSEYGNSIYEEAHHFANLGGEWAKTQSHKLVHVHDWMTYPAGIQATNKTGNPLVAHVHATEFDRAGSGVDHRIAELEYQGLTKATHIIAVSNYTKRVIHNKYNVPNDKISVVHNGIDLTEFTPHDFRTVFPHDKIVLFVGRLTYQKGVDYFLESAKKVLSEHPNTVFVVAGTGDMEQQLMMQAAYLGIGNRVIFAGFLSGNSLNAVYQMADVFVMPSVSEPYGIVALEAVARGIPTIISKQSGVAESLKNVKTVDYWDTYQLAQEISNSLRFPNTAREWAKAAKLEARKQTWDIAAAKTIRIYQGLLS
jgi:glycosyltransferase involved in cell wall biosynthesis